LNAKPSELARGPGGDRPSGVLSRRSVPFAALRGRGDMMIAAAGLALAVGCALFPWYVFFNQEKFGVPSVRFEGSDGSIPMPTSLSYRPELLGRPISAAEVPVLELDLLSTGTLPDDPTGGVIPLSDQPFPGGPPEAKYKLVHVANGRAMLEDENGLWVVQPGSLLPDDSRVSSIERRAEGWVLVTSANVVIPIAN
jgi:hypothetical protein